MLTTAYNSSIRQVGTQRWLNELSRRRQRRQHFGTLRIINGLRAVGVGSSSKLAEAPQPHFLAPPCKRCWQRLAAQLAAASMRTVLNGSAWFLVGSFAVAYSAPSVMINRVCMMPLRYSEVRWPRRWHDLQRQCLDRL